jgi:hypothetical protein
MVKSIVIMVCIGMVALSPLCAANVSVLVIETGRPGENQNNQYTLLWENGLLDGFFEMGHIVSNSPIMQLVEKPVEGFPVEAERDFDNAQQGGMDYFIITVVDYTQSYVSLRLFRTNSPTMIREQKHAVKSFRNTKEEQDNIKATVRAMAAHLN